MSERRITAPFSQASASSVSRGEGTSGVHSQSSMFYICSHAADCQANEPATVTGVLGKTAVNRRLKPPPLVHPVGSFCRGRALPRGFPSPSSSARIASWTGVTRRRGFRARQKQSRLIVAPVARIKSSISDVQHRAARLRRSVDFRRPQPRSYRLSPSGFSGSSGSSF